MLTITNKTDEEAGICLGGWAKHALLSREAQLVWRLFSKYGMIAKKKALKTTTIHICGFTSQPHQMTYSSLFATSTYFPEFQFYTLNCFLYFTAHSHCHHNGSVSNTELIFLHKSTGISSYNLSVSWYQQMVIEAESSHGFLTSRSAAWAGLARRAEWELSQFHSFSSNLGFFTSWWSQDC